MSGRQGYKGWRWVFILEGVLTCVVAMIFFFVLPDFPEDSKWVNEEERIYIKARLQADQGRSAAERKITLRDVGRVFGDFKVWIGGVSITLFVLYQASLNVDFPQFMYFGMIVPAYGYAYFAPGIIQGYGYGAIQTQLHSVNPLRKYAFF